MDALSEKPCCTSYTCPRHITLSTTTPLHFLPRTTDTPETYLKRKHEMLPLLDDPVFGPVLCHWDAVILERVSMYTKLEWCGETYGIIATRSALQLIRLVFDCAPDIPVIEEL